MNKFEKLRWEKGRNIKRKKFTLEKITWIIPLHKVLYKKSYQISEYNASVSMEACLRIPLYLETDSAKICVSWHFTCCM